MNPRMTACWVALAITLASAPSFAQSRIGFVSLDRILRDAAPAQRAQKKIEAEFAKRDQELAKLAEQLKRMQENVEKNAVTMSESERGRREREFNDANRDFQRKQREFREDLNLRKNEELAVVLAHADKAIREIAESEGYDVILQEAVYRNPKVDITDKVLKYLSAETPEKSEK